MSVGGKLALCLGWMEVPAWLMTIQQRSAYNLEQLTCRLVVVDVRRVAPPVIIHTQQLILLVLLLGKSVLGYRDNTQ